MGQLGYKDGLILSITIGGKTYALNDKVIAKFYMFENLNVFLPTAQVIFFDYKFRMTEELLLSPVDKMVVQIGTTLEDLETYTFELISIGDAQVLDASIGSAVVITTNWMLEGWDKLLVDERIRSGNVSASDIVSTIAGECGYVFDGESSIDKKAYIQAMWTNAQMVRDMSKRAKNKYGDYGFIYAVTRAKKLLFYSWRTLYEKESIIDLEFVTNPQELKEVDGYPKDKVLNYNFKNKARMMMAEGALGRATMGYDWEEMSFLSVPKTLEDTAYISLSAKLLIDKNELGVVRSLYSPDWNDADRLASNDIITTVANLFKMDITIVYNEEVKLGKKVNLRIPGIVEKDGDEKETILETISGHYIVQGISHLASYDSGQYLMKVQLMRDGVDNKFKQGLLEKGI